jgi:protein O-mannosyl-transferase
MAQKDAVETSLTAPDSIERSSRTDKLLKVSQLLILMAGILAYLTSFQGDFAFDDHYYISKPFISHLWPPWTSMFAPETVSRPLIGLSLAINYAISGTNVWSYHLFNLLIHLFAALALFGIVRRTLLTERLREDYGKAATSLALAVALIWVVHPLNTQAVTYIIQRCESLMGMFYLLTLYCAIRSFDAKQKRWWYAGAIAACTAGVLSKQVMVTAPLMVLIYDWLFVSSSLKEVLRKRWNLYAGLFATWMVLAATMIAAPVNPTAGFATRMITPLDYFKSEFAVIVYYLRLAIWPNSLCLDYAWPKAQTAGEIAPYAIVVGALVAVTLWALYQRKAISFTGVWFFLILSLTSSIMPFEDLIYEYRMYLPLAGVVTLVVLGSYHFGSRLIRHLPVPEQQQPILARKIAIASTLALVTWFTFLTAQRNFDYKSEIVLWRDVINKRPQNSRAHNNLGILLLERGLSEEALAHFSEACKYKPDYADAQCNLGWELLKRGNLEEGKFHLSEALRIKPQHELAHFYMGNINLTEGNTKDAIDYYSRTLKINPRHEKAYFNMGNAFEKQGDLSEAIKVYRNILRLHPERPEAMSRLAFALVTHKDVGSRNAGEALQLAEKAASLTQEQQAFPLEALAAAYAELGRFREAIEAAQKAMTLASGSGDKQTTERMEARLKQYKEGHTS